MLDKAVMSRVHIARQSSNVKGCEKSTIEILAINRRVLHAPRKKKEKLEEEYKIRQEAQISKERESKEPELVAF